MAASGAWRLRGAALQTLGGVITVEHGATKGGAPSAACHRSPGLRPDIRSAPAPGAGTSVGVLDHGAQELPDARHVAGKGGGSGACGTAGHDILHQGWRALPKATKRCIPALHLQGARKGTAGRYTRRRLWTSFIITDPHRQSIPQWVLLAHRAQQRS